MSVIQSRVQVLLQQWPENAMLQDLLYVVDRVLRIPLPSPVAAALQSLEVVLTRISYWDRNAARRAQIDVAKERIHDSPLDARAVEGEARAASHFSEAEERARSTIAAPLLFLVERWRKIELRSWDDLLNGEEERCTAEGQRWWFHLHSACSVALEANAAAPRPSPRRADAGGPSAEGDDNTKVDASELFEVVTQVRQIYSFVCSIFFGHSLYSCLLRDADAAQRSAGRV